MRKSNLRSTLAAVASPLVLVGCVHTAFTPTSELTVQPRPDDCPIDIVLDGRPERPHRVLGRVTTDSTAPGLFAIGENQNKALERLKVEACKVGGHVLYGVGTGSQGQWTNDGYSKSTQGSAIVAVYVNDAGQVLSMQ